MTADMKILGWRAEGLRCPDHSINLIQKKNSPYNISLIQMPNGTGKTTTLTLLRAALSGDVNWSDEDIKGFAKKNSSLKKGIFEVFLLLNNKKYPVVLNFDFESNTYKHQISFPGIGLRPKFERPPAFRNFMKGEFVNFYIFDGELAAHLLDKDYTHAEAVVEKLFQVDQLIKMSERTGFYWDEKTKGKSAKKQSGKTQRSNQVTKLRDKLSDLEIKQDTLSKEYLEITDRVKEVNQQYEEEIAKSEELSERFSVAQKDYNDSLVALNVKARDLLDIMACPHALTERFSSTLIELKEGLDRVKLPESAAKEFFVELADEEVCVCGRPINKETREKILERSEYYLGSDDVSLLNSMKTDIEEALKGKSALNEKTLTQELNELDELRTKSRQAYNDLDFVKNEIDGIDPEAKKVREELEKLMTRQDEIESELKILNEDDPSGNEGSNSIDTIKRLLKEAEKKLEEVTDTINLGKKRDILKNILIESYDKSMSYITSEIRNETNEKIEELMPDNNIRIEKIDKCLVLKGQSGGSAGEQLSIAYAFLATLFSRSEHTLPFIVDSPAGPIDLAIRPKIGNLIPQLTDQFVAFTISSEREKFVSALKKKSESSIQYLTVFKSGNNDLEEDIKQEQDCTQTQDGYIVEGENFFNKFQIDEE